MDYYPKFCWISGRQQSGYSKMLLSQGKNWDCWILKYPSGSEIPTHIDSVPNKRHYRFNFILKKAVGGKFSGQTILNLDRLIFFRPDICPHSVSKIESGTRYVLSFGFCLSKC